MAMAALLLVAAAWSSPAVAADTDVKATDADWTEAIEAANRVALNASADPKQRAAAVIAAVRLRIARGTGEQAIKTAKAVFDNPGDRSVATAAIEAASLVVRQRRIDLGGRADLLSDWSAKAKGPASRQAAKIATQDINRARGYLAGAAARRPIPAAITPRMPSWGRPTKSGPRALAVKAVSVRTPNYLGPKPRAASPLTVKLPVAAPPPWSLPSGRQRHPSALRLSLPVYTPPPWYKTLRFTPLKPV